MSWSSTRSSRTSGGCSGAGLRGAVHQPRHRHRAGPVRPDPGDVRAARSSRSSRPRTSCAIRCTRTPRGCSGPTATRAPRPSGSPTSRADRRTSASPPAGCRSPRGARSGSSGAAPMVPPLTLIGARGSPATSPCCSARRRRRGRGRRADPARVRRAAVRQDGEDSSRAPLDGRRVLLRVENVARSTSGVAGSRRPGPRPSTTSSFVLRKGEVTALVGQSGSGKSTLARMITGVEQPDQRADRLPRPGGRAGGREVPRPGAARVPPARADGVPGPVLVAQPGARPSATSWRGRWSNYQRTARARPRAERVDELLETVALTPRRRYRQPVRLRALRWSAAAGRHRPGAGRRARADRRRRADLQPGRVDPRRDPRAAQQARPRAATSASSTSPTTC